MGTHLSLKRWRFVLPIVLVVFSIWPAAAQTKDPNEAAQTLPTPPVSAESDPRAPVIYNLHPVRGVPPEIFYGDFDAGGVVARLPMQYGATGRIVNDVIGDGGVFTRDRVVIPAGTPVFALTLQITSTSGYVSNTRAERFWCGVLDAPSRYFSNGRGFCIETDSEPSSNNVFRMALGQGSFIRTSNSNEETTPYFPEGLGVAGRLRSDVEVRAEPVEFPAQLSLELRFVGAGRNWVSLGLVGLDGLGGERRLFGGYSRYRSQGEPLIVEAMGQPVRLEMLGEDRVRVSRLR